MTLPSGLGCQAGELDDLQDFFQLPALPGRTDTGWPCLLDLRTELGVSSLSGFLFFFKEYLEGVGFLKFVVKCWKILKIIKEKIKLISAPNTST